MMDKKMATTEPDDAEKFGQESDQKQIFVRKAMTAFFAKRFIAFSSNEVVFEQMADELMRHMADQDPPITWIVEEY